MSCCRCCLQPSSFTCTVRISAGLPAARSRVLALKPDTRMRHTLSDSERHAWLRLARTAQVGPVTFAQLIARFSSASQALAELPRLARRGGSRAFEIPYEEEAAREIEATQKIGGRIIASCE